MRFGIDMSKYESMTRTGPAGTMPEPFQPSQPSSIWNDYKRSLTQKNAPTRNPMFTKKKGFFAMTEELRNLARFTYQPGGDAINDVVKGRGRKWDLQKADKYMAEKVVDQYKRVANPMGVYNLSCTEGTNKGMAEDARVYSLGMEFRKNHRSVNRRYFDFFEMRKMALINCGGCSYEEGLVSRNPRVAMAMVRGYSEAKNVCVRYSSGQSKEEDYMARSVDRQMKERALPFGVYEATCSDGTMKGMAEFKRVQGLAAKFRAGQYSINMKEQSKFDAARIARDSYGHGCDYEEDYFNKYKAVSAAMRPSAARY